MIFTRIRMWGKLSTLANKANYPCVFFPCLIPTTFFKNLCWQLGEVMAVIVLGYGVAALSVLAYALHSIHPHPSCKQFSSLHDWVYFILTHRLLVILLFIPHAEIFSPYELLNTHVLQIHVLTIVAHLHARNCCYYSRTPNFASSLCSVHFPPLPARYYFPRTGISLVFTHAVSSTDL